MYKQALSKLDMVDNLKVEYKADEYIYNNLLKTRNVSRKDLEKFKLKKEKSYSKYINLSIEQVQFYKKNKNSILRDINNMSLDNQKKYICRQKDALEVKYPKVRSKLKLMLMRAITTTIGIGAVIGLVTRPSVNLLSVFALMGVTGLITDIGQKIIRGKEIVEDKDINEIKSMQEQIDIEIQYEKDMEKSNFNPVEEYTDEVEYESSKGKVENEVNGETKDINNVNFMNRFGFNKHEFEENSDELEKSM